MKRNLWIGIVAATVVMFAAVSTTGAICIPPKLFSTYNGNTGTYYYVQFGTTNDDNSTVGQFWQTGARAAANEGTCTSDQWIIVNGYYPGTDSWYLNGDMGGLGCMNGCVSTDITVTGGHTTAGTWFAASVGESGGVPAFDFTSLATNVVAVDATPRVSSSSRSGDVVTVNFATPDLTGGVTGDVVLGTATIYKIASATRPSNDLATGWVAVADVAAAGGTATDSADCADPNTNVWYGLGVTVEGEAPSFVSSLVEVECDPNLADPDDRFRLIDRPSKPGRGKLNPSRDR
jgi:hypothetical protein